MKKRIYCLVFTLVLTCTLAPYLMAQDKPTTINRLGIDDLDKTSYEDLINSKVVVASKSAENINDAPGVISVVTAREIEQFGGNNLIEVLERVTSVYSIGSSFAPNNIISIRGDLATPYNNHTLILINGRPTRETLFGGIDYPVLLAFPLNSIERIEIIRGPGSVLYGTNAYTGVINIITKEVLEETSQVTLELGSFNTVGVRALDTKTKNNLKVVSALHYFNQQGWALDALGEGILDSLGNVQTPDTINFRAAQNNLGGFLGITYKDLKVSGLITYSSQANTGVLPVTDYFPNPANQPANNREINTLRAFLDLGYRLNLNKRTTRTRDLLLNATYNQMATRFSTPNGDFVGNTRDLLLEATSINTFSISNNQILNFLAGGSLYVQRGGSQIGDDLDRGVPDYTEFWINAYAQLEYPLPLNFKGVSNPLKLIAGAQFNRPTGIQGDIVPRVGLLGDFEDYGFKLLYGQAFRAAFEAEHSLVDAPVLRGEESIEPEKVTTFDAQIYFNPKNAQSGRSNLQVSATYFRSIQRSIIVQELTSSVVVDIAGIPFRSDAFSYANANRLDIQGIELEGRYAPRPNFFLNASMTYQSNTLNDSLSTNVPELMVKIGAFYDWTKKGIDFGIFNTYFSRAGTVFNSTPVNAPAKGFSYLTAKIDMNIGEAFGRSKTNFLKNMTIGIYANNLLNQKILYPEFVRGKINTFPGRGGFALYGSARIRF